MWLLSAFSGVLLWLGWPPSPAFPLLFVGFLPFFLADRLCDSRKIPFRAAQRNALIFFFFFNLLNVWWVGLASELGLMLAVVFNSLFMSTVWLLARRARLLWGPVAGAACFVIFWLAFEYLHMRWVLTFSWLTLGNGLAVFPQIVQWYEWTGVYGGSLWILVSNVLIGSLLLDDLTKAVKRNVWVVFGIWLLLPLAWSIFRYSTYIEQGPEETLGIVQPNYDPYAEKFNPEFYSAQLDTLLALSSRSLKPNTKAVFWPETSIPDDVWSETFANEQGKAINKWQESHPNIDLVGGAIYRKRYISDTAPIDVARRLDDGSWYASFNAALWIAKGKIRQIYYKSQLVLGVETLPFPGLLGKLQGTFFDLGGVAEPLGTQPTRDVFALDSNLKVAPVICYESVYGEHVTGYMLNGGTVIGVITNDGWWGNTPGYRQHLLYGGLRCIENRRSMVRSANTGISGVINQRGDMVQHTKWWRKTSFSAKVQVNKAQTFYTRNGDFIGRAAWPPAVVLALASLYLSKRKKKKLHGN